MSINTNIVNESVLKKRERLAEIEHIEFMTGKKVLTWEEMAARGWTTLMAMEHRQCSSKATAKGKLNAARGRMRQQGWLFPDNGVPIAPAPVVEPQRVDTDDDDKPARGQLFTRDIPSGFGARLRAGRTCSAEVK